MDVTARRMTDSPSFSKHDADRILRRAAEIEGSEDTTPLSVDELRSIAGQAGFGAQAVERAIAEIREAGEAEAHRPPVQKWGWLRTRLSVVRRIPIEITSKELMEAVRLLQPYRDGPPQLELQQREITWRDRKGLQFSLTSVGGVTEIRVFVSKFMIRKGRWIGWVKAAADRLETLVELVAEQDGPS